MKTRYFAGTLVALFATMPAFAEDAAPASPHTFTANVGMFSQYIFRGISQTNEDPALQGGFDYAHSSGFYIGTWASNISWLRDSYTDGTDGLGYRSSSLEVDLYGGYQNQIGSTGIGYNVGLLQYFYPGSRGGTPTADTLEAYGALSYGWLTGKYSYVLSDEAFQFTNADGTWYAELNLDVPFGETGLKGGLHVGRQDFSGSANKVASYTDYRISLAYDLGKLGSKLAGTEIGAMYTDNNSSTAVFGPAVFGSREQFTGYLKRTF